MGYVVGMGRRTHLDSEFDGCFTGSVGWRVGVASGWNQILEVGAPRRVGPLDVYMHLVGGRDSRERRKPIRKGGAAQQPPGTKPRLVFFRHLRLVFSQTQLALGIRFSGNGLGKIYTVLSCLNLRQQFLS